MDTNSRTAADDRLPAELIDAVAAQSNLLVPLELESFVRALTARFAQPSRVVLAYGKSLE